LIFKIYATVLSGFLDFRLGRKGTVAHRAIEDTQSFKYGSNCGVGSPMGEYFSERQSIVELDADACLQGDEGKVRAFLANQYQ